MSHTPLHIALLTHSTNPRGGVVHALELAEALSDLGHHPAVHAPDPSGRGFFRPASFPLISVPARHAGASLLQTVRQRMSEYSAYFSDTRTPAFDVYHAQDSISANALADLAEQGRIPGFTRTVHHLDSFDDPALDALQTRGVLAASQLFCVSTLWQQKLLRLHGVEADVVPSGVSARFTPQVSAVDSDVRDLYKLEGADPLYLAVGGVEPRKNSVRVLQAFAQVLHMRPNARLVIAGGATLLDHADYRSSFALELERHRLTCGLQGQVLLTGVVLDEHMPSLYRLADALVFPSITEGFGLVLLEAMASGIPVVASRIEPFLDFLPSSSCLWVDPFDTADLLRAMLEVLEPQTSTCLRQSGPRTARLFAWESSARRHLELYQHVASKGLKEEAVYA